MVVAAPALTGKPTALVLGVAVALETPEAATPDLSADVCWMVRSKIIVLVLQHQVPLVLQREELSMLTLPLTLPLMPPLLVSALAVVLLLDAFASALASAFAFHGSDVSLPELDHKLGISRPCNGDNATRHTVNSHSVERDTFDPCTLRYASTVVSFRHNEESQGIYHLRADIWRRAAAAIIAAVGASVLAADPTIADPASSYHS